MILGYECCMQPKVEAACSIVTSVVLRWNLVLRTQHKWIPLRFQGLTLHSDGCARFCNPFRVPGDALVQTLVILLNPIDDQNPVLPQRDPCDQKGHDLKRDLCSTRAGRQNYGKRMTNVLLERNVKVTWALL